MSTPYTALRLRSQQAAEQFRMCHDIEAGLALVEIVETMAALCVHLTAQEQQLFAQLLKAILACQERQDWLGLADYLAWEWADLLLSIDARLAETAEK